MKMVAVCFIVFLLVLVAIGIVLLLKWKNDDKEDLENCFATVDEILQNSNFSEEEKQFVATHNNEMLVKSGGADSGSTSGSKLPKADNKKGQITKEENPKKKSKFYRDDFLRSQKNYQLYNIKDGTGILERAALTGVIVRYMNPIEVSDLKQALIKNYENRLELEEYAALTMKENLEEEALSVDFEKEYDKQYEGCDIVDIEELQVFHEIEKATELEEQETNIEKKNPLEEKVGTVEIEM